MFLDIHTEKNESVLINTRLIELVTKGTDGTAILHVILSDYTKPLYAPHNYTSQKLRTLNSFEDIKTVLLDK